MSILLHLVLDNLFCRESVDLSLDFHVLLVLVQKEVKPVAAREGFIGVVHGIAYECNRAQHTKEKHKG